MHMRKGILSLLFMCEGGSVSIHDKLPSSYGEVVRLASESPPGDVLLASCGSLLPPSGRLQLHVCTFYAKPDLRSFFNLLP